MIIWTAIIVAVFVWWFATGLILMVARYADQQGERARQVATWATVPVLLAGLWGYELALSDISVTGAYVAFFAVLAIWGWIELAFLTGIVTGPITKPLPTGASELERFIRAWGTVAFHEILLVATLIVLFLRGWAAENTFGMWTFGILYAARISAKLNLFFGVPRVNIEFLPTPLLHLPSHFKVGKINWMFPVSVSVLTLAIACWLERVLAAGSAAAVTGFALLLTLTTLALIEHWLMILPLPDAKLWRWMLPGDRPIREKFSPLTAQQEDIHGL